MERIHGGIFQARDCRAAALCSCQASGHVCLFVTALCFCNDSVHTLCLCFCPHYFYVCLCDWPATVHAVLCLPVHVHVCCAFISASVLCFYPLCMCVVVFLSACVMCFSCLGTDPLYNYIALDLYRCLACRSEPEADLIHFSTHRMMMLCWLTMMSKWTCPLCKLLFLAGYVHWEKWTLVEMFVQVCLGVCFPWLCDIVLISSYQRIKYVHLCNVILR